VSEPVIDYRAVFQGLPGLVALLTPDLLFADVNEDFLRYSGRSREQLIGRHLFEVFPDNPNDPAATGVRNLEASLLRVLAGGERDPMALQRYDVQSLEPPGEWAERFWSPINAPVKDDDGHVVLLVHRVEEVTELIRARGRAGGDRARVLEAELAGSRARAGGCPRPAGRDAAATLHRAPPSSRGALPAGGQRAECLRGLVRPGRTRR
jgi:hypothetical protein